MHADIATLGVHSVLYSCSPRMNCHSATVALKIPKMQIQIISQIILLWSNATIQTTCSMITDWVIIYCLSRHTSKVYYSYYTLCLKCANSAKGLLVILNAPNLTSCSLDKHWLIFIVFGQQHQNTFNKNLAIANRSLVSCTHNTSTALIVTPRPQNLG